MARRLPPLNSLRAFEAAARLGSFTLAADELCVTHGAISRHVQQLESWLNKPLFARFNRRVLLTADGEAYLAEVSASFDRIALATQQQLGTQHPGGGAPHQLLRVNAQATFALRWLVPRLSQFQAQHPDIEVRLTTSNDAIEKVREDVDLFIRGGPQAVPGYLSKPFLSEVRRPVCSPKIAGAKSTRPMRPADLKHHTLLHAATYPGMWAEWLTLCGVPDLIPKSALTLEHFFMTLQAAIDGVGMAMAPTALVADDIAEGRLVFPFDGPSLPPWHYYTYIPEARQDDASLMAFCDWLAAAEGTVA